MDVPSSIGIAHLGIGAFHRAHQAVYTQDAGDGWGICGITQRSPAVADLLTPQDGLYTVLRRDASGTSARVIGTVREVLTGEGTVRRLADPAVRVISLTVTEKGYRHDPATGRLRTDDPEIALDLAGRPPRTVIGRLVHGLATRDAPVTVLCCDNLAANGPTLRGLVGEYADLAGVSIGCDVAFPATMVDRIVPATTSADLDEAEHLIGLRDEAAVVTEPFTQWVIEDAFAAGRPAWESAGAILTADVAPYETMKLRLLNGAHSMLAYLGTGYVSDAVAEYGGVLRRYLDEDAGPTLAVPDGFNLEAYKPGVTAPPRADRDGRLAEAPATPARRRARPAGRRSAAPLGRPRRRRVDASRTDRPCPGRPAGGHAAYGRRRRDHARRDRRRPPWRDRCLRPRPARVGGLPRPAHRPSGHPARPGPHGTRR
jgi:fructuronate reductase